MAATVHPGGQREALLHALGANETHGHRRTDADRRHAVELMLADPEWREWNNSAIARQCRVSEFLVRTVRQELAPPQETQEPLERTRKVTRGGKTYTMRTGRIGTAARAKAPAAPSVAPPPAPTPPVVPAASGGSDTADVSASVSSMQSKIDTLEVGVSQPHQEETPPSLWRRRHKTECPQRRRHRSRALWTAWQQASDDERKAFVARYRDDLRASLLYMTSSPKSAGMLPSVPRGQSHCRSSAGAQQRASGHDQRSGWPPSSHACAYGTSHTGAWVRSVCKVTTAGCSSFTLDNPV